jgi:hypothetical protein
MGAVVSSQAGASPRLYWNRGSGDIGVVLDTKSKKEKKGPNQRLVFKRPKTSKNK